MATISANLPLNAGDTGLTLFLYSLTDGSLLNTGGDSLTEVANGLFQATVDETIEADLRADAKDSGGNLLASDTLYLGSSIVGQQPQVTLIDEIATNTGGAGVRVVNITVSDGASNVPFAPVQLQDAAGNTVGSVRVANGSGVASLNLDDGSYKAVVGNLFGYESHTAEAFTVDEDNEAVTLTLTPSVAVSPPSDPALCNVLIKVRNQYGQPLDGATVTAKISAPDFLLNTVVSNEMNVTSTTDVNGEAVLTLIRAVEFIKGGEYQILIKVGTSTQKFSYYVPNVSSTVATFTS